MQSRSFAQSKPVPGTPPSAFSHSTAVSTLRAYYELAKPGIVYGNAISALGGFFLASHGALMLPTLAAMLAGLSLVVASGCVFNNYLDRDIDRLMLRTQERPLPRGAIAPRASLVYATFLGLAGTLILARGTTPLATTMALFGLFTYVILYTLLSKRRTPYATHLGSIAGAMPPVVGYCAVTGRFDLAALILFVMLCLWQMPHFFAIALFRRDDYAAAKIPVWPIVKSVRKTKEQIVLYVSAFAIVSVLLWPFGYTGIAYGLTAIVLGIGWIALSLRGFRGTDDATWAKRVFLFSLVILSVLCAGMALDARPPTVHAPIRYVPAFV